MAGLAEYGSPGWAMHLLVAGWIVGYPQVDLVDYPVRRTRTRREASPARKCVTLASNAPVGSLSPRSHLASVAGSNLTRLPSATRPTRFAAGPSVPPGSLPQGAVVPRNATIAGMSRKSGCDLPASRGEQSPQHEHFPRLGWAPFVEPTRVSGVSSEQFRTQLPCGA
jgi:hypothetical protein